MANVIKHICDCGVETECTSSEVKVGSVWHCDACEVTSGCLSVNGNRIWIPISDRIVKANNLLPHIDEELPTVVAVLSKENRVPTHDEFRKFGFTGNAGWFPLDERQQEWLAKYNGIDVLKMPDGWRYAPNKWTLDNWDAFTELATLKKAEWNAKRKAS